MADKKLDQYAAKAQAAFEQNKTKREAEVRLPSSSVSGSKQQTGMERLVQGVSDFFGIKQPEPPKQKSILQRLMEVPVQQKSWYSGEVPTVSEAYAQIYKIGQKDQAAASQLFTQMQAFQQDPTTPFYNPYTQATNRKIADIASYGVDVSKGINDDFFKNNSWLMNYYSYGSTNNPLGTAKKRSKEQNAAAIYYDLLQDEDRTKKAENEWAALQEEVKYWAGRTDRNLSDAEILDRIDWSKYKTLQEMDESAASGAPIALNRAVGYSKDNLYGVLWEARNNVTGGDAAMDAVRYRLGQGKSWKANSDIESRLDPANSRYNPYWTGNTMDNESLYFGVQEFGKNWLEDNKWMRGSNDATEQKMYQQVYSAEEFTQKAEAELESLNKVISDRMKTYGYDADKVLNGLIDDERYPSLTRLDESLKTGKLVDTTRAIRYSAADVERMVRDKCAAELNKLTSNAFAKDVYEKYGAKSPTPAGVTHKHEDAVTNKINEQKSKNISDAKPTIADKGTRGEQVVFTTASSPTYNDDVVSIADTASHGVTDPAAAVAAETQSANEYAGQNYIGAKTTLDKYDRLEKGLEQIEARIAELFGSAETEDEHKAKGAVDMSRVVGTAAGNPQERSLKAPSGEQSTKVTKDEQVAKERWISDQLKVIGDTNDNRRMMNDAWDVIPQSERDRLINAAAEERAKVAALDEKDQEELYQLQQEADSIRAQLKDMAGAKAEAEQAVADIYDSYGISADLSSLTGAETEGTIIQYLDILAPVLEEDIPYELSALSIYDQMEQDGYTFDQAMDVAVKSKAELQECLDLLTEAAQRTEGYIFPTPEQNRRYQQEKNYLEQSIRAADYYLLRGQDDFAATAQKGLDDFRSEGKPGFFESWSQYNLDLAIADPSTLQERSINEQRRYDLVNHMTDAERQTYFYIRETQGTEAAKDYFNYLTDDTYGCITRRIYDTATAEAQGMADASPVIANLYSIVTSPTRALGGMYGFYQAMRGEAVNPYSNAMVNNAISSQIKETTHEKIDSALGADTWGAKAAGFFYDALSSAAESGVNAIVSPHLSLGTATSFFGKLGLKVAESVVGASVMGLGAAGDEMRRVVMDGGTVEQALSMGAVTFLSETLSEGISIGNITESFNRAIEFGGPQAVQVLMDLVRSGVEEGSEEILGGLFSNWQEDRIMGELSERSQLAQQFKQEYIRDHEGVYDEAEADKYAQEMADKQIWKNLLKEGLSGFVSGVVGPAAATVTGTVENKVGGFVQERQQQRAQRKADQIVADNLAALNADTQAKTQAAQQAEAALEQARAERAPLTEEQRADAEEKAAGLAEQADAEADAEYNARIARLEQEAEQARAEAERAAKQEQALRDFAESQEQSRNDAKAANEAAQKAKEAEEAARKARERADRKAEDYRVQQENEQKADQAEREAEQMRQEAERMAEDARRSRERAETKYNEYAQMYEAENAEVAEAPAAEGPAEAPEETPAEAPAEQPAEAPDRTADAQRVTNDVTILSQAASGDQSAQTAAVAGVLSPDGADTQEASYAAQQLMMDHESVDVINTLKKVFLTGVQRAGAQLQDVKQAIVTAAENAQGNAHAILESMLDGRVTAKRVTDLIAAAQQENSDPATRDQVRRQIKENRVDQRTKELIGNGAAEALKASQEKVDKAKAAVENAKALLQDAKDRYGEITQRIRSLTEQLVNEPQNDTVKKLRTDALAEAKGQASSIENMERAVDNARNAFAEATARDDALKDKVLQPIREQAVAEIEAEDAAAAQALAGQMAAMEQAAAEEQARQMAERRADMSKAATDDEAQKVIGGDIMDADLDQMLTNAGVLHSTNTEPESMPAVQSELPTQTPPPRGQKQRQFGSQTAQRSDALHDEVKEYLYTHSGYDPDTNRAQIDRSIDWVRSKATEEDPYGYQAALDEVMSDDFNYSSADGQARMLTVMSMAALQNRVSDEVAIADAYNKQGTQLGRALQARNIFAMMTPLGRKAALRHQVDDINRHLAERGRETTVILPDDLFTEAGNAKTPEEFERVQDKARKVLAKQIPPTFGDQLRAWRMLSMLGNPRTHIRNIVGNAIFMPVVSIKNKIGTVLEMAYAGIDPNAGRTKSFVTSSENRAFARQDAENMQSVLTGEQKRNETSKLEMERDMFGTGNSVLSKTVGKALQKLSDVNSKFLEDEDWFFMKRHYTNALAGWMQANHVTPEQMKGQKLDQAREYAITEAQKATYRDYNDFAAWLNKASRSGGFKGFLVDAVLPFKKTPANILKRGIEYSPVGLIRTAMTARRSLAKYEAYTSGKVNTIPKGAMSPTQVIDSFASGLTGSAICAIGYALAKLGIVTCGLDKDEDEFEKLRGRQEYSLNIGLLGHDVSMTIDWAAPVCMPFFVGAAIHDAYDDGNMSLETMADALLGISEPMFNLSMLDSVNSLLRTSSYSDTNQITQIAEKIGTNYVTSFVPSLLGAASRTYDPISRKAYVPSGEANSQFKYAAEQVQNKTPWSIRNIPYRNAFGDIDKDSRWKRAFENFISPGYINKIETNDVYDELERLYQDTGDSRVIPSLPSKYFGSGENRVNLTDKQYDQLTVDIGQMEYDLLEQLFSTDYWEMSSPADRADMVGDIRTYSKVMGQAKISDSVSVPSWVSEASKKGVIATITKRREDALKTAYLEGHRDAMAQAAADGDYEAMITSIEALKAEGKENSGIKSSMTTRMKPKYQEAAENNDTETMLRIESMLLDSGLGYKEKDFKGWLGSI